MAIILGGRPHFLCRMTAFCATHLPVGSSKAYHCPKIFKHHRNGVFPICLIYFHIFPASLCLFHLFPLYIFAVFPSFSHMFRWWIRLKRYSPAHDSLAEHRFIFSLRSPRSGEEGGEAVDAWFRDPKGRKGRVDRWDFLWLVNLIRMMIPQV